MAAAVGVELRGEGRRQWHRRLGCLGVDWLCFDFGLWHAPGTPPPAGFTSAIKPPETRPMQHRAALFHGNWVCSLCVAAVILAVIVALGPTWVVCGSDNQ